MASLLLTNLCVVMCCPLTKRLKVEFLRTCLFSTMMMWCHSPSLIKSGNQTRAPKSPVKSGCQSLLLLIGAKQILEFQFLKAFNGYGAISFDGTVRIWIPDTLFQETSEYWNFTRPVLICPYLGVRTKRWIHANLFYVYFWVLGLSSKTKKNLTSNSLS